MTMNTLATQVQLDNMREGLDKPVLDVIPFHDPMLKPDSPEKPQ